MTTTASLEILSAAELRARAGRKWHDYPEDVLPAWVAEMDFPVAEPIRAALRRLTDEAAYGYESASLQPTLKRVFAEYMQRRYGWRADSEHVLAVADLVQALYAAVMAFTAPDQGIVLQTPIYPPFQHAVRETGRRIVANPLIDDGSRFVMDTAGLPTVYGEDAPLLLLCNPHNPTGRAFTRAELEALADVVVERKLVVVTDEVHADLTYRGTSFVPFASLGPEVAAQTVTITSATKAYNIPGLRCGVMHFGSEELRERFRQVVPDRMLGTANQFGVEATCVAWTECDAWLEDVLAVLESNRERLRQFMASELPEVGFYAPEATYLAWLDCSTRIPAGQSAQRYLLEHARVAMSDGTDFGSAGHARLNFGTSPEILDQILERLGKTLR